MKKTHVKVTLNVLVHTDEEVTNVAERLKENAEVELHLGDTAIDVMDVEIQDAEILDSR